MGGPCHCARCVRRGAVPVSLHLGGSRSNHARGADGPHHRRWCHIAGTAWSIDDPCSRADLDTHRSRMTRATFSNPQLRAVFFLYAPTAFVAVDIVPIETS